MNTTVSPQSTKLQIWLLAAILIFFAVWGMAGSITIRKLVSAGPSHTRNSGVSMAPPAVRTNHNLGRWRVV